MDTSTSTHDKNFEKPRRSFLSIDKALSANQVVRVFLLLRGRVVWGGQKKEPILIFAFPAYKLKEIPKTVTKRDYQRGGKTGAVNRDYGESTDAKAFLVDYISKDVTLL